MAEECDENDYHFDLDSYKPVQPITFDHGIALFPVAAPHSGMDLHLLQVNFVAICVLTNVFRTTFVSVSFLFSPYYVPNFVTRLSRSSINVAMRFNCLKRLRDVRECKYLSSIYYLRNAVHTYLCIV